MTLHRALFLALLLAGPAAAQLPTPTPGGPAYDRRAGVWLWHGPTTLGDVLTAIDADRAIWATPAAGAPGGSGNSTEVSVVLTDAGYFSTVVTGQAWVAAASEIVCRPFGTTADSLTPEVIAVSGLQGTASDRVVATGFTLHVYNPFGLVGTVRFHCLGV